MLTHLDYLGSAWWILCNRLHYKIFINSEFAGHGTIYPPLRQNQATLFLRWQCLPLTAFCLPCLVRRLPVIFLLLEMKHTCRLVCSRLPISMQLLFDSKRGRKSFCLKMKCPCDNPASWSCTKYWITLEICWLLSIQWKEWPEWSFKSHPTLRLYDKSR